MRPGHNTRLIFLTFFNKTSFESVFSFRIWNQTYMIWLFRFVFKICKCCLPSEQVLVCEGCTQVLDHWRSLCLIHLGFFNSWIFQFWYFTWSSTLWPTTTNMCIFNGIALLHFSPMCVGISLLVMELYGNAFSRRVNSRKPSEVAIFTLFMSPKLCSLAFNAFLEFCRGICSNLFTIQTTNVNVRMLPKVAALSKVTGNVKIILRKNKHPNTKIFKSYEWTSKDQDNQAWKPFYWCTCTCTFAFGVLGFTLILLYCTQLVQ